MSTFIEDGKGTGYKAAVNSSNELEVRATIVGRAEWENHNKARAFVMYFSQASADAAANEIVGYIKNTSDLDMVIDRLSFHAVLADTIYVSKVTGTAAGGTAVVPTNANVGSGETATGTFSKATAHTGLTDAGRLVSVYLAAQGWQQIEPIATIVIKKNSAIGIFVTADATQTLNCTVWFHYEAAH
jgi:hypothetical protein